jgi:hypothetical protein
LERTVHSVKSCHNKRKGYNTDDSHYMCFRYPRFHRSVVLFQYHEEYEEHLASISSTPSTSAGEPVILEDAPVGSHIPSPTTPESSNTDDPHFQFYGFLKCTSIRRNATHVHNKSHLYYSSIHVERGEGGDSRQSLSQLRLM